MKIECCFNCEDRWVTETGERCHDTCAKYRAEHDKNEQTMANKRKILGSRYKSKNYEKRIGRI